MAFSATCPTINDERFRAEYESLPFEEKNNIRNDLYGFPLGDHYEGEPASAVDDENHIPLAVKLFYDALGNIPNEKKVSYEKAKSLNPKVVETESNPLLFLRHDNWDPWAAACRMVEYWQVRGELFGGNFARPMTVGGALSNPRDLEVMKKGVIVLLPVDQMGRVAFQWDRILQKELECDRSVVLKIFFYICHKLAISKEGQRNGVMAMFNMRGYSFYRHWDRVLTRRAVRTVSSIPLRCRAIHFFTGSGPGVISNVLLPMLRPIYPMEYRQRIVLHSGSLQEVLAKVEMRHFILPGNLGTQLGGTYTNEQFWSFIQKLDRPGTNIDEAYDENKEDESDSRTDGVAVCWGLNHKS